MAEFETLHEAHRATRRGKRRSCEVLRFENDLAAQLWALHEELLSGAYRPSPYAHFVVREPKIRQVFAPRYRDRVVQQALCATVLEPALERRLIYDNAACRVGKGVHFSLDRLAGFMRHHWRKFGAEGYVLRCDVRHYFASIRHRDLLEKLERVFTEERTRSLLEAIVDSFEVSPGVGLPLGNQTSQWFALLYCDGLDRLVKEHLRIHAYVRYMDDAILIHPEKDYLKHCLKLMMEWTDDAGLEFNAKTQIFPLSAGIPYLGFHSRLTPTGGVTRRVSPETVRRMRRRLAALQGAYERGEADAFAVHQSVSSYIAHLSHGDTYGLRQAAIEPLAFKHNR
ncbi:MAG: hypothetical protein LBM23_04125 [Propionibacteriaceae bacterium]|jgi:hypothetical protein|nr:hypothetical protein [Propionibacteriaceae bacterium]